MSHKPWEHAKSSGSETNPLAARFVSSLDYDKRLYKHDIMGSRAQARMLAAQSIITAADRDAILAGLDEIEAEITAQGDAWEGWKIELEDVHMCVEAALVAKTGDAGRKLHTGRSRNDQVALDLRLWCREAEQELQKKFFALVSAFVDMADRCGTVVMPSYTHLQRAQPIVAGAELLAWADAFDRCAHRAHLLGQLSDENPLGSGAIAGSCLPLDRDHTTGELGFSATGKNSLDGTASRDAALDTAWTLAMAAMWLSRFAEQWIIYASTEFSFIAMGNDYTTGSSMMPQKRNPDMLELIRGKSGQAYGSLIALLTMCKGITIGYNRDLQEDKKHLFAAYDSVCDSLDMAAGLVGTASFREDKIAPTLARGYLDATGLAEYLVAKGIPFRTGHQVVGYLVHLCDEKQLFELKKLSLADFNAACAKYNLPQVCGEDLYGWLGAENVVKRYQSAGNGGMTGFETQLAFWKMRLMAATEHSSCCGTEGCSG